jgi:hypothetical protein
MVRSKLPAFSHFEIQESDHYCSSCCRHGIQFAIKPARFIASIFCFEAKEAAIDGASRDSKRFKRRQKSELSGPPKVVVLDDKESIRTMRVPLESEDQTVFGMARRGAT